MAASAPVLSSLLLLLVLDHATASSDCATRSAPSADPFEQMCYLVLRNRQLYDNHWSVASGHHGFHNHIIYHIVALYKLGANASRLQAAFDDQASDMDPAVPSAHFISDANWKEEIGAWQSGRTANSSVHYSDYVEFFAGKVAALGAKGAFDWAFPSLVDGVAGDLFHPAINLGYFYESGDAEALIEGLAWMATGYTTLGKLNRAPSYTDMRKAMDALHSDARLPAQVSVDGLASNYADVMAEYDLKLPAAPSPAQVDAVVKQISLAVLTWFATDGYTSFSIVHVTTGTRAMQSTVAALSGNPAAQAQYLRRHWSAVLYYYVALGRPEVVDPAIEGKAPSWPDLASAAMAFSDTHLAKMVYLSRANHKLWGAPLYQQVGARVVALFQGGGEWKH